MFENMIYTVIGIWFCFRKMFLYFFINVFCFEVVCCIFINLNEFNKRRVRLFW